MHYHKNCINFMRALTVAKSTLVSKMSIQKKNHAITRGKKLYLAVRKQQKYTLAEIFNVLMTISTIELKTPKRQILSQTALSLKSNAKTPARKSTTLPRKETLCQKLRFFHQ